MADLDYFRKRFATFKTIEEEEEELKKKKSPLDYFSQEKSAPAIYTPEYPGAPVDDWKIDEVAKAYKYAIEQSENPQEMEDRFNTAYYLAKSKGMSFTEAFDNMESILEADYGKALSPKSGLEAVANVWKAQSVHREISKYTYELKNKALSGDYETMEEVMGDPLYQQVQALKYQLPPEDMIKRDWPVEWAKKTMQILPSWTESLVKGGTAGMLAYMGTQMLMGGLAGSAAGPVGAVGGAIVSIIPTIAKLAGSVFGAVATAKNAQEMEGGAAFFDMIEFEDPVTKQKLNPLVAAKWATAYEGLAAAVEMSQADAFFKPIQEGMNVLQKRAVTEAIQASAKSIADASTRAGLLVKIANSTAGKWFLEWGKDVAQETAEEGLQEGLQIWSTESAKLATNRLDGTSISPAAKEEITKRISDTIVGSVLGMGLLQAGPATFSVWAETSSTVKQAKTDVAKPKLPEITPMQDAAPEVQAAPEPTPLYIKTYEPSPGVVEIRGTDQPEGTNRTSTVISVLNFNDDEKTATVSSITYGKAIKEDPDKAIAQSVEILKNAKSEFPGYSIIYAPDTALGKKIKETLEQKDPEFFKIGPTEAATQESDENAAPGKENAVALQQEAIGEERSDANQAVGPESDLQDANSSAAVPETEEYEEQDSLATLQKQGAQRVESTLADEGYTYTSEPAFEVDKIQFHPDLPNFKEGANKEGVVNPITGKPEPMGMPPIIVYQTKDDKYYLVTGRHRLDLWKRNSLPSIPTQVLKEEDGYTLDDMSVIDAEMNIRDNQGSERDYARYFRRTNYTYERAEGRGLLRTSKAKSGFYIGSFASPALQTLFFSGRISADKAAAIAEAAPNNEGLQAVGIKLASDRSITPEVLKNSLAMFATAKSDSKSMQGEIFGDDTSALDAQVKIAKGAAEIKNEITSELSVLKQAARFGEKDRIKYIEKYGYKLGDTASLSSRIEELADLATKWEGISWTQDQDLFYMAKNRAGLASEEEIAAHTKAPVIEEQGEVLFEPSPSYNTPSKDIRTGISPWIYKSQEIIQKKMSGPMPGKQILSMLQGAGVKADELKWVDLETFLNTDKKLTPQEVDEYIAGNKLQIQEVEKDQKAWDYSRQTKYDQYVLPGGQNYRELLFTLPVKIKQTFEQFKAENGWAYEGYSEEKLKQQYEIVKKDQEAGDSPSIEVYHSQHWNEPNVLAHTRLNDRITADGKRMLFIEEIQSDLHQEGRKKGYQGQDVADIENKFREYSNILAKKYDLNPKLNLAMFSTIKNMEADEVAKYEELQSKWIASKEAPPSTPFSKTWHEFVFKRLVRMAVEEGYDSIGWTTGEQQNDRYPAGGEQQDKIAHGMEGFYDKILVDFANKYGKKWGAQVRDSQIKINQDVKDYVILDPETEEVIRSFDTTEEGEAWQAENDSYGDIVDISDRNTGDTVHSLPVTDLMKVAVPEGQYLFEKAKSNYGFDISKADYRRQMVKAREITKLMADNADGFFIDEVKNMVTANTSALIDALQNAKSQNVAFSSSAEGGYSATLTPAQDGSSDWDINLFIEGEQFFAFRYKDRAEAIENLFTEIAPHYGSPSTWKVIGEPGEFELTSDQMGDIIQKEESELELFEYDDTTIDLVYGSKEAFNAANESLQLDLFGDDGAGDLFVRPGDQGNGGVQGENLSRNSRREPAPVSSLLGTAGVPLYPQIAENRKGQRRVSFVGQTISRPKDIAELFQVYRNSQVETFHLIYLDKKGKIIAHNALSSGVAGRTKALEGKQERTRYYVQERVKKLKASQVYLLHNHPSGLVTPSYEDMSVTKFYMGILKDKFKGHVVIDHDTAAIITDNDINNTGGYPTLKELLENVPVHSYKAAPDSYNTPSNKHLLLNQNDAMIYALSTLNNREGGSLIIADYQYRAIEWRTWNNPSQKAIYQAVKESGGSYAFFATNIHSLYSKVAESQKATRKAKGQYAVLVDAIYVNGDAKSYEHSVLDFYKRRDSSHYDFISDKNKNKNSFSYTMEGLADEAKEFDSYQEFKDAYLEVGEDDSEVKKAWSEAQKSKSPAESNEDFIAALKNDRERLMNFLKANGADLFNNKVKRNKLSVVDATSYRLATGGQVPEATIQRTMMLIEKYPDKWRARYAELTGETIEGIEVEPEFEISGRPQDISILEARHKEAIENLPENLKKDDAYKSIKDSAEKLSEKTAAIRKDLEKKKKDLASYEERFSYAEKRIVDMQRESKELNRRIWAERSKSKLRGGDREYLKQMEQHKKDLDEQILERINALSPQAAMKDAAYLAKQQAIKETTKKLKEEQALAKAKKTERDLKLYYAARIKRNVSKGIDFKIGLQIKKLQNLVDPYFRRMAAGQEGEPLTLPSGTPLNLWNLDDLKKLHEDIENLREYGRSLYEQRTFERAAQRAEIKNAMIETAKTSGKERPSYYYGTQEQIEQSKADKTLYKTIPIALETIHRIARELDGGKEGVFYNTVVELERDAFRSEKENFDRRMAAFEAKIIELGLNRDDMYRQKVNLGDQTITKWEAIALYIGSQNRRTEAAIVYGNMMMDIMQEDKNALTDEQFYAKAMQNRQYMKEAISTLTPEEIELANFLIKDGDAEFDRIAEATYQYENRIPDKEGVYFPHERKMRSGEDQTPEEMIDRVMVMASKATRNVGKQPTLNRSEIPDKAQSPINLDAYQVYRRGFERQEHYIAYAKLISDLNSILKNTKSSTSLRETIRIYHGQAKLDYLDRWISEAANPKAFTDFNKPTYGLEKMFKNLRGPLGVAYLGYRVSRGVFQLITSPAPYLPYAGQYMISRMVKNLNPAEFMKTLSFAKKNSAFIRHRIINPTDAYIKQYLEKNPTEVRRKAMEAAGAIMQWSDIWSVTAGWTAIYEKKAIELKNSGMTTEQIHTAAVKEADKVTIETQPTYRQQDLSPAFKSDSELSRFLFQFQTPLNVIYNQLYHDTKSDWKSGHKGRSIAIVAGYMMTMGLMAIITAPRSDDDDETKKAKEFLSGALSIPLEAIPFVGSMAAGYVESLITGERFYRDDQIFPGVKKALDGASRIATAEDHEARVKAFIKMMEGAGMLAGVPTSALKEYYRVLFEGDWGALIGKRQGD